MHVAPASRQDVRIPTSSGALALGVDSLAVVAVIVCDAPGRRRRDGWSSRPWCGPLPKGGAEVSQGGG
ncbi:hypothetical protein ACQEVF_57865 [Nonomuraea polychroma]|uniref:hypothetical protein n=1 Tax=Nonomuraea polychroma TaxID=46176 RepID=UPI003D8A1118